MHAYDLLLFDANFPSFIALLYRLVDFFRSCLVFPDLLYCILSSFAFPYRSVTGLIGRLVMLRFQRKQLCGEIWNHLRMASWTSGENFETLWSQMMQLWRNSIFTTVIVNAEGSWDNNTAVSIVRWQPYCQFLYLLSVYPSTFPEALLHSFFRCLTWQFIFEMAFVQESLIGKDGVFQFIVISILCSGLQCW